MTKEQQYWEDTQEALSRIFDRCEEIDPQSGYDMLEDIQFIRCFINKHKPQAESEVINMTERRKYKKAFKIACELLNGSILYGYDSDRIFSEMMEKDDVVSSDSYEKFILNNLDRLDGKKCNRTESGDKE